MVNFKRKSILCLIIVYLMNQVNYVIARKTHPLKHIEISERILQLRCQLKNFALHLTNDESLKRCQENLIKEPKPGSCPKIINENEATRDETYIQETYCQDGCKYDSDCPATQKCCSPSCGFMCSEADDLLDDIRLPPIPLNLSASIIPNQKSYRISWEMPLIHGDRKHIYFHVEIRSHPGTYFSQHKLSDWQWQDIVKTAEYTNRLTERKTTILQSRMKSGRWYQFRVAAINEFGFRGYTEPTKEIRLPHQNNITAPKPPKAPENFSIVLTKLFSNGTMFVRVIWCTPKSDLPIEKYKVSWSIYVDDKNASKSFIINSEHVPETIHHYDFHLFHPNSYYLQVQAITISGKHRLKSQKVSIFFKTSLALNNNIRHSHHCAKYLKLRNYPTQKFSGNFNISIAFIHPLQVGMLVRVSGIPAPRGSFFLLVCEDGTNCKEKILIRSKKEYVELGLKYDTKYHIRLIDLYEKSMQDGELVKSFTTPSCTVWRRKFYPRLNNSC